MGVREPSEVESVPPYCIVYGRTRLRHFLLFFGHWPRPSISEVTNQHVAILCYEYGLRLQIPMPNICRVQEIDSTENVVADGECVPYRKAITPKHVEHVAQVALIEIGDEEDILEALLSVLVLFDGHNHIDEFGREDIVGNL